MIIHLKDTAIQLNPSEVRAAKKLISRFITSVSSASKRTGQISFYFTVLIIIHIFPPLCSTIQTVLVRIIFIEKVVLHFTRKCIMKKFYGIFV